ncbi:MAG: thioredoxin [Oscillospiraceae bacterium]|nr:thioredoxin [Oscillospiraceae bacterium]
MALLHLNKDNFNSALQENKRILVDFFATWCGPCRMMGPILEQICEEFPQFVIAKVDVDENPELASQYGVMSIPTLVLFENGEAVDTSVGAKSKPAIISMLSR